MSDLGDIKKIHENVPAHQPLPAKPVEAPEPVPA